MTTHRIEHDALGEVRVPQNAYYGAFTARALENFQLSGFRAPDELMRAYGLIKIAAARANNALAILPKKISHAIEKAAAEFAEGRFREHFMLDPFQAGAGTPWHMNANEIIANRANEILGAPLGSYKFAHPNNHVNYGQSSNDVTPTAMRIAALYALQPLLETLNILAKEIQKKGAAEGGALKIGRTHLEDAVPITVKQEFDAWAAMILRSSKLLAQAQQHLYEIHLGGTALGTGITAHPKFQQTVVAELKKLTGFRLKPSKHLMELTASMDAFLAVSGELRRVATDLLKIAQDLKLLNMGPLGGIGEITLPEVEPGSSIMPGKVNPSIPEAVEMTCYQIFGYDLTISRACQAGQLQLNIATPVIAWNLLHGISLLANTTAMFTNSCIKKIEINTARINNLYENSLCTATALSPYLGYHATAEIVKAALKSKKTIRDITAETGFLSAHDLAQILSPSRTTKASQRDQKIYERVQNNERYQAFLRKLEKKKF